MPRQHVAVKFNDASERTYTFHNDGDPVVAGDWVLIQSGGKTKAVIVHSVRVPQDGDEPLGFETKGIMGLAPPKPEAAS